MFNRRCERPLHRIIKELVVKAISRRKFVAAAAVVGAGAVLRTPAFAFENQNAGAVSARTAKPVGHEVVASQASPLSDEEREAPAGRIQPGGGSQPEIFEDGRDRPVAAYLPLECRPSIFRRTAG